MDKTPVHTVWLIDKYQNVIGFIEQDWFYLPEIVQIDGQVYCRVGPSGAHKYQRADDPYVITEKNCKRIVLYD